MDIALLFSTQEEVKDFFEKSNYCGFAFLFVIIGHGNLGFKKVKISYFINLIFFLPAQPIYFSKFEEKQTK
ncbi:MAG: hypothetical protein ACI8P3_001474 [Saprospiraceae bacterium]|jgi:hypothetical protein